MGNIQQSCKSAASMKKKSTFRDNCSGSDLAISDLGCYSNLGCREA